jgi:hypothetical protein
MKGTHHPPDRGGWLNGLDFSSAYLVAELLKLIAPVQSFDLRIEESSGGRVAGSWGGIWMLEFQSCLSPDLSAGQHTIAATIKALKVMRTLFQTCLIVVFTTERHGWQPVLTVLPWPVSCKGTVFPN